MFLNPTGFVRQYATQQGPKIGLIGMGQVGKYFTQFQEIVVSDGKM